MKAGFSGEKQLPTVTIPCRDDVLLGDFVVERVQEERLPTVNLDSLKEVSRSNILQQNKTLQFLFKTFCHNCISFMHMSTLVHLNCG